MNLRVSSFDSNRRLNADKISILIMFAHSRLTGKSVANDNADSENVFSGDVSRPLQENVNSIIGLLDNNRFTTQRLDSMKDSIYASTLTYYYNECLNVMNSRLKKGSKVIDSLIGMSILTYLIDSDTVVVEQNSKNSTARLIYETLDKIDFDFTEVIAMFEASSNCEEGLVVNMQRIASEVIEKVRKANYITFMRQKRKQFKRK